MLEPRVIHGRTDGRFLDDATSLPLLEQTVQLDVPLYLRPGLPIETLRRERYTGFDLSVSYALGIAAWGGTRRPNYTLSD
jgi:hypothetical protein